MIKTNKYVKGHLVHKKLKKGVLFVGFFVLLFKVKANPKEDGSVANGRGFLGVGLALDRV